jgi:carboxymethylenebutenolidase
MEYTENVMSKILSLTVAILFLASAAFAATSQPVSYKSGDETVQGVLYTPANSKSGARLPAIIVIHEWWGLNDWVKEEAGKLADQGYVTLAIDLYRGKVATTPDEAHELMRGLPDDRSLRDLKAAFDYLAGSKEVDAKRIGAIGWCMGGGKAALLAANEPRLKAVSVNYGSVPADESSLANWKAATLGLFGGKDRGIPPESAQKFEATMKKMGRDAEVHIYPNSGHAFQNPNNKGGYQPEDAADAWKRITEFFAAKLKK